MPPRKPPARPRLPQRQGQRRANTGLTAGEKILARNRAEILDAIGAAEGPVEKVAAFVRAQQRNQVSDAFARLLDSLGPAFTAAAAPGIAQSGNAIQQGVEQRLQRSGLLGQSGGARTTTGIAALGAGAAQGASAALSVKVRQAILDLLLKAAQGDVESKRRLEAAKAQAEAQKSGPFDFLSALGVPFVSAAANAFFKK